MKNRLLRYGGTLLLAAILAACGGDDGEPGAPGATGATGPAGPQGEQGVAGLDAGQIANPETCVLCHAGGDPLVRAGYKHQALYDQFYQDGVMTVTDLALASNGIDKTTLTFKLVKNGGPFDCTKSTATYPAGNFAIGSVYTQYDATTRQFSANGSTTSYGLSLVPTTTGASANGTKAYDSATNLCTFTKVWTAAADKAMVATIGSVNAIVQLYGTDEITGLLAGGGVRVGKYPFAAVKKFNTVDYTSAANVSGCENCHTKPYLKHGYIYGTASGTEFYTCKGCHSDTRNGGHQDWQLLYDDEEEYARLNELAKAAAAAGDTSKDTVLEQMSAEQKAKYAYKSNLMNDVHMSHNMEFGYPQNMTNCVTCHAGKLDQALATSKFQTATCQSCHAVDNLKEKLTSAEFKHDTIVNDMKGTDCTVCHDGSIAPTFKQIHNGGYDPKIYTDTGVRYSDAMKVKVDSATFDSATNKLSVKFSATAFTPISGLTVDMIKPTVVVAPYGYNSKDFIVAAHGRSWDDNADGVVDSKDSRNLEYVVGTTHPRFTTVTAANGSWEVTADMSKYADKITAGEIKRVEIAVLPALTNAAKVAVGVTATSRTFDLATKAFDESYFKTNGVNNIVRVEAGCNNCHAQLGTTFHSPSYGGSVTVCRTCHEVSSQGSHLELQSRSIDSYVHAIHSFQAFDPGDIDFGDPVESLEYEHKIGSTYPTFGILNCESCHNPSKYEVPDQAKSMPGALSGTDAVEGRNIGSLPPSVTGPAVRACGACHRSQKINADDSSGLSILNQHFRTFGYMIDSSSTEITALWQSTVAKIMAMFD